KEKVHATTHKVAAAYLQRPHEVQTQDRCPGARQMHYSIRFRNSGPVHPYTTQISNDSTKWKLSPFPNERSHLDTTSQELRHYRLSEVTRGSSNEYLFYCHE